MKNLLYLIFLAFGMSVNAQVAINNDNSNPDPSAMLDVKSTDKGLLLPRMTLAQRNAIVSPANGLMIYQTDNSPGFYYNSGSSVSPAWVISGTGSGWGLTGNSGTSASINFIGTIDNIPLTFKVNNQLAGKIDHLSGNTSLGFQSLNSNTTGHDNTATGKNALASNTTGLSNTANGSEALNLNTTGGNNTASGVLALSSNTTGSYNNAFGVLALYSNTTGDANIAFGGYALNLNTSGDENIAIGNSALEFNTSGSFNTATGTASLNSNTTGYDNTATGYMALESNSTGYKNTANGWQALFNNSTGYRNTATGAEALNSNTTGYLNTADGVQALYSNTTGIQNTAIGRQALWNLVGGNMNIALGANSGTSIGSPNVNNTISIGNDGYLNAATNQAFLGNLTTGWNGGNVTWSTYSDGRVKNNVREDVIGLDFITRLRPVTYYRNIKAMTDITGNEETKDYPGKYDIEKIKFTGFLAQEVEQAAQQANYDFSGITIPKNSQELYTLSYEQFVVPLVKAVQEQQAMIEKQQQKIEELEKAVKNLSH